MVRLHDKARRDQFGRYLFGPPTYPDRFRNGEARTSLLHPLLCEELVRKSCHQRRPIEELPPLHHFRLTTWCGEVRPASQFTMVDRDEARMAEVEETVDDREHQPIEKGRARRDGREHGQSRWGSSPLRKSCS